MIVIYTSPGCASCRKVKQWMKDHELPFTEKNIFKALLNSKEIKYLLMRCENGTDDIISKRSKILVENKIDIDSMTIDELILFIQQNPSVLKRPIIINEKRFQVGFDSEEIGVFIPEELKKAAVCPYGNGCQNYEGCGGVREECGK